MHLAAVRQVWDYHIERLGKNAKVLEFTRARQQKGLARLREALKKTGGELEKAAELMRIAVDTIADSPWHVGNNPQKERHDSWELFLFGSQERFEEWLQKASRQ